MKKNIYLWRPMVNVLYIHGMGGGSDSRIPSVLKGLLEPYGVRLVCRTYDFEPVCASGQIDAWVKELAPGLVIGESLGSLHALRVSGVPHILVSPSLNAPIYLWCLGFLTFLPGITAFFNHLYRPKEGDRQPLHFTFGNLKSYRMHRNAALSNSVRNGSKDWFHAFFGTRDHYRKSAIVSVRTWEKYFGNTFSLYDGTHFMEEEHILTSLLPCILKVLSIKH